MGRDHGGRPPGPGVVLCDVFPRDGLQTVLHQPQLRVPTTEEKISIIEALDAAGVPEIEITGFVHPKVIPSLADAESLTRAVMSQPHDALYRVLVPNYRGAERALAAGATHLKCMMVASETYQRLNSNNTVGEAINQIGRIVQLARAHGAACSVGIGTSFVCPYEGLLPEDRIHAIVDRVVDLGIHEVTLSDSIGLAWPTLIGDRCRSVLERWPRLEITLHLHTLAGLALANAYEGYKAGVRCFDGSVGGIGGGIAMPVHTDTMANVATEDLVYMFEACGIATGIDLAELVTIAHRTQALIGTGGSHASRFGSLDRFLEVNREGLAERLERPPGDSSVEERGR